MEYTKITGENIEVSRVGLGTWAIGGWMWGGTDKSDAIKTVQTALEKGITLIDTAPVYGFGASEEVTGEALEPFQREDYVLATKVGLDWKDESPFRNSSPERLKKEIDDSLKRLKTDYIDIYQIHWPDPSVPFEQTAETMQQIKESGKIRAIGVSNYSPEQMKEFQKVATIDTCQPPYNIFERDMEQDIYKYCKENSIDLITYGALCRGLLSGKMSAERSFEGDDLRKHDPKFQQPRFDQYLEAVDQFEAMARENYGKSVLQLAVRWIMQRGIEVSLWGARKPDQLSPVDEVTDWQISESDMKRIDEILSNTIKDPVGPGFMAPPSRE